MLKLGNEFCIVLRTNKERTADLAEYLLKEQFEDVTKIEVAPFSKAVQTCYEIAMNKGAKWLITCDGDVLINERVSAWAAEMAATIPSNIWQILGKMNDKLYMGPRTVGFRFHRVSMLADKIEAIDGSAIRVEGNLCKKFPNIIKDNAVLGKHDYEQWYRDIRKKAKVHKIKHATWADAGVIKKWRRSNDLDLRAARSGWDDIQFIFKEKQPLDIEEYLRKRNQHGNL